MNRVSLRHARDKASLSREALALRSGINARTIYDIEHNLTIPRRSTTLALALAVGRRPSEIAWPTVQQRRAA